MVLSVIFVAFLSLQCHVVAADYPEDSAEQDVPQVTRTPEQLALEQQYAEEQRVAALAFFACVSKAKDSGFLGVGQDDASVVCTNEREQYARYLPQDQAALLLEKCKRPVTTVSSDC
jgi:hypothetical protein